LGEEVMSWGMTLPRTVVKRTAARARMRVGDFILSGESGLCCRLEVKGTESLYIW